MDQQIGRQPGGDEFIEQFHIRAQQGLHRGVAGEDLRNQLVAGDALGEKFRHRDRRFKNQRCVDHVTEVENAHALAGVIEQQVARVAIAMDGLRPQSAHGAQLRREAVERKPHQTAARARVQVVDILEQRRRLAYVPDDPLAEGRVKVSRQRPVQACQRLADTLQGPGIGSAQRGQRARHERNHAHVVPYAGDHAASQGAAVAGLDDPRHRERRRLLGQITQHAALAIQGRCVGGRVHDLEHEFLTIGGTETEIAVPLAGQGLRARHDPEVLLRQSLGVRGRHLRRIGPKRDQAFHAHHSPPPLSRGPPPPGHDTCEPVP